MRLQYVGCRGPRRRHQIVRRIARPAAAKRSTSTTSGGGDRSAHGQSTITNLVKCPCGHTLSRHDAMGCGSDQFANNCSCKLTPWHALDAAIAEVRRPGPSIYDTEDEMLFDQGVLL